MKKLEWIYREILYQFQEKHQRRFVQKDLAALFRCSLSTVSHAIDKPRAMGAVRIGGRFGEVSDARKLALYWATIRRPARDTLYETSVPLPVLELEGQMVPGAAYGAFSAFRRRLGTTPADYDHVYVYVQDAKALRARFPPRKGPVNLTAWRADPHLTRYGPATTAAQTFADLWNLPQWYARDFADALLEKMP